MAFSQDGKIGNKKLFIITAAAVGIVCLVLGILTRYDFMGDLVLTELDKAVSKQLNVKIKVSPLTGNPIIGFKGTNLELVRSDDSLIKIKNMEIYLSLPSLIKNSPRIGTLVLDGLSSDIDSLNSLLPKKKEKTSGTKDIPIDRIKFLNTEISTKWGLLRLDNSSLELRGTEWFAPSLKGSVKGIPFTINGICSKEKGNWLLNGFIATLDSGSISLSGNAFPSTELNVEVKDLDLNTVASLIPEIRKYGIRGIFSGTSTVKGLGRDMALSGGGKLKDALLSGIPLSEIDAAWNYDRGLIEVSIGQGKILTSSIAGRLKLDTRSKDKYLELSMKAKNLNFADWTDKLKSESMGNALFLQGGISSLSAELKGPLNALVGNIIIAPSTVSYRRLKLTDLHGTAAFNGKPSGVMSFSAMYQGNRITLDGTCSFADNMPNDLKFNADKLPLESLVNILPSLKKSNLKGAVTVKATIEGFIDDLTLRAKLSSASIQMEKVGTIKNISAMSEYNFKYGALALKSMSCLWNGSPLTASGITTVLKEDRKLSFKGAFKNIEAEKLYRLIPFLEKMNVEAKASGSWNLAGTTKAPTAAVKMSASNGRFRNLNVDRFSMAMSYSSNVLTFDPMNVTAAGGTGILKCRVTLPRSTSDGRGRIPATWDLTAKIKNVDLSALNGLLKMNEDIDGPCTGDVRIFNEGSGMRWTADVYEGKPRWRAFRADEVRGLITGSSREIETNGLKVSFLKGDNLVKGKVFLAEHGTPALEAGLDLSVASEKINMYELLRKYLPALRSIQGFIKTDIKVTGTAGDPKFNGTGTLSPFRYRGLMLPVVDVEFNGGLKEINILKANAKLHRGSVTGTGRVYLKDEKWNATLDISGKDVALRQFGAYLPERFRAGLGGQADFNLKGRGKIDDFLGEGSFSSNSMRLLGIKLENVKAPIFVSQGYAVMEDVTAETNGGSVSGGVAMDLKNSVWGGTLSVLSADIEPLFKQAFPNIKGTIRGKGDLKMRVGGETGRMSTVKGGGILVMRKGDVSGFEAVEATRKFTNNKPLRFETIQATATYDGGNITILPGTQAIAPDGDPVYRNVMLDGLINKEKKISMFAMGKVNIRVLNVFLGALQGIINTGMDFKGTIDRTELFQNFLGGMLSGFAKDDFRFVTLNINGTPGSLIFSNVKVDKTVHNSSGKDMIPTSASDPENKDILNKDTRFRLSFEIPVGPGKNKTPSNVEGQVIEQTLENLLKNIDFGN